MEVTRTSNGKLLTITRVGNPPGLRLEGEFDATWHEEVMAELAALAAEHSEIRLDLAGVEFMGLDALSALTGFVHSRDGGVRLVLDNLPLAVENLITTIGWERLPGLLQGRKEAI